MADSRFERATEFDAIGVGPSDSTVAILAGTDDLSGVGVDVPVGSLYLHQSLGRVFTKKSGTSTDWVDGTDATGVAGAVHVTAAYTAGGNVVITVDTTAGAVPITLPNGADFVNKVFHVKWVGGDRKNKVQLIAQTGELIDDANTHILGDVYDSLNILGHATGWWIL